MCKHQAFKSESVPLQGGRGGEEGEHLLVSLQVCESSVSLPGFKGSYKLYEPGIGPILPFWRMRTFIPLWMGAAGEGEQIHGHRAVRGSNTCWPLWKAR